MKPVFTKAIVISIIFLLIAFSFAAFWYWKSDKAHLEIPSLFAANSVLQRNKPVKIFGKGKPCRTVTVEIAGNKAQSQIGFDGLWLVTLAPMQAGGPYLLKVSSANEVVVSEPVYIGDVWFALGQSNMAWYVDSSDNAQTNINQADQFRNKIFWFESSAIQSAEPRTAFDPNIGNWITIDSHNVKQLSAVAYSFAREIYKDQQVPIGIIQSNYGNTKINSWMSKENLLSIERYKDVYQRTIARYSADNLLWYASGFKLHRKNPTLEENFELRIGSGTLPGYTIWFNNYKLISTDFSQANLIPLRLLAEHNIISVRVSAKGLNEAQIKLIDDDLRKTTLYIDDKIIPIVNWSRDLVPSSDLPSVFYNSMIGPFIPYTINGILWYQGESDVPEYQHYSILFANFINDLRAKWQDKLPVFYVQLHSYKSPTQQELLPRFREVQDQLSKLIPEAYMVTAVDLSNPFGDIHSPTKDSVGERLALAVRKHFYNQVDIKYTGPTFSKIEKQGNIIVVYFDSVQGNLLLNDKSNLVQGFTIAGEDKKFYPATAKLKLNTVELSAPEVSNPVAVRYAWSDMQTLNLTDSSGLPIYPFRTDAW